MVDKLLTEGIIRKADFQGPFCSNSHAVSKPDKSCVISGRADLHIMKMAGETTNHARLTLDKLINLNKFSLGKPKVNLPSYKALLGRFKRHFISCFDLCAHYWSISLDQIFGLTTTSILLRGYQWDGLTQLTSHKPHQNLPTVSKSMIQFLAEKGWSAGSEDWPFQDISEIIVIYLDDLCLSTPQDIKNGRQVHLHALEFVFWRMCKFNFKISKSKCKPWQREFKFLGHHFNVEHSQLDSCVDVFSQGLSA
jgi:hypothetical protein